MPEDTTMTRSARFIHRFRLERLERRDLLCSSMAATAGMQAAAQLAPFAQAHTVKAAADSGSSASDESSETHLFATLTSSSSVVVGTAFYETEVHGTTTTQELLINVAGGAANASYTVTVGTTNLGTLTTDANGNGRLYLTSTSSSTTASSSAASTAKGSLPAGFTLAAGATIGLASTDTSVDALNGTFATAAGDLEPPIGGHGHRGCGGEHGTVSRVEALLSNSGTSAGKAVFTTITQTDGTSTQILRVRVTGAGANATLDVSIDGTSVGSITTDADGNGHLILSSNPHNSNVGQLPSGLTITSTSTITVGTAITGSFSSSSSFSGGNGGGNDGGGHSGDCGGSTTTASVRSNAIRRR
jgi:hypothetical protein